MQAWSPGPGGGPHRECLWSAVVAVCMMTFSMSIHCTLLTSCCEACSVCFQGSAWSKNSNFPALLPRHMAHAQSNTASYFCLNTQGGCNQLGTGRATCQQPPHLCLRTLILWPATGYEMNAAAWFGLPMHAMLPASLWTVFLLEGIWPIACPVRAAQVTIPKCRTATATQRAWYVRRCK